ncbi:hypothetical protein ACP70R_014329 [Stipagrostis hirtigluma subsp. patula]
MSWAGLTLSFSRNSILVAGQIVGNSCASWGRGGGGVAGESSASTRNLLKVAIIDPDLRTWWC